MAPGSALRVIAVVQARYSSRRLPGKVLRPMRGRPMLSHVFDGLSHSVNIDGMVLATSTDTSDDPVAAFARDAGIACHRGSLTDVASRMLEAARSANAGALVRISGDSPLLDPALVDQAVSLIRSHGGDLVTNVARRTFPQGQSVEVISYAALARALTAMTTPHEREHVTPHFYARPGAYVIRSFEAEHPRPELQLSVNDPQDFERCEAILEALGQPHWQAGWEACARASDRLQARARA